MSRERLKRFLPPVALDWVRRLRPARPDFQGVYERHDEVPDEDPFRSDAWLEFSRRRLELLCSDAPFEARLAARQVPRGSALTALLVNDLSWRDDCRVLDFAGGSGAIYHQIRPLLTHAGRVQWDVVDAPHLAEIGQKFLRAHHRVRFFDALPPPGSALDVVHVCTSLQYIAEWEELAARLFEYRARYVVLTRLLAGDGPSWWTGQIVRGRRTPCVIVSEPELDEIAAENGYAKLFRAPALEELLEPARWDPAIPEELRIPYALNVVYAPVEP